MKIGSRGVLLIFLCVVWTIAAFLLRVLLVSQFSENAILFLDGTYLVLVFLSVGIAVAKAVPTMPKMERASYKAFWFILAVGWVPVLLSLAAAMFFDLEEHTTWMRVVAMGLGDCTLIVLFFVLADLLQPLGMRPQEEVRWLSWAPCAFLLLTIGWILVVFVKTDAFQGVQSSVEGSMAKGGRIAFWCILLVWALCYALVMTTQAGSVEDIGEATEGPKKEWTRCGLCTVMRPQRCKHCSKCNTCVLRMDHHCPWLHGCIGYRNYKYFVIFLFWSEVLLSLTLVMLVQFVAGMLNSDSAPIATKLGLLATTSLVAVMVMGLGPFLGFHLYLISKALTTIEYLSPANVKFNFNQGRYRNIQAVLGDNPLIWLLPICPPDGDGASFPYVVWTEHEGRGKHIRLLAETPRSHFRSALSSQWVEEEAAENCLGDMQQSCIDADIAGTEGGEFGEGCSTDEDEHSRLSRATPRRS